MDEKTEVDLAAVDGLLDFIKGRGDWNEIGLVQSQGEIGARQRTGDSDVPSANIVARHGPAGNQARPVLIAHRGSVRQQSVGIGQIGVGVNRDRGDFELTAQRALVERFYILELVDVMEPVGLDFALGESIKHECVVGVGAVRDVNGAGHEMAR